MSVESQLSLIERVKKTRNEWGRQVGRRLNIFKIRHIQTNEKITRYFQAHVRRSFIDNFFKVMYLVSF